MFENIINNFTQKPLLHSELELTGEIPYGDIEPYRTRALQEIALELDLPGFRKGFVPQDIALKKVGELSVLEEAVEMFVREFYPKLVEEKKIDAIGRPDIRITKLAPNNPIALTIRTALYPKIELPKNWQDISNGVAKEEAAEPTPEELEATLKSLQESRKKDEIAPELTDEFAKSVGAFQTLDELKTKMKEGMFEEKKRMVKEKRRAQILDALLEKTQMDIPGVFVESEQEKMLSQLKDDITRFNISFEEYLKRTDKTEDALRADFREQAEKRAKLQLMLNTLADQEKIEPDEKDIEVEMKHALEHFPDAKPELLRIHIQTVLRNEKVLKMLEAS